MPSLSGRCCPLALGAAGAPAPPPKFDSNRAWEHLRQLVAIGPRPAGSPAIEQTREYIKKQLAAAGVAVVEQAWDDQTPLGTVHMVNLIATIPGAQQGSHRHRRPLRHQAVPRVPVRRRQRRRVERGVPDRAGARAEGAARTRSRSSCCSSTARKRSSRWQGTDNTYGSRHYVEAARRDGSLATLKALVLVDMIGDRDLRDQARHQLDAVADRHRLGRRQAAEARRPTSCPSRPQIEDDHLPFLAGRRAVGRHHRPRLRRRGTPRRTRSTRSAPAACRSSATSCSPRCRRLKRGSKGPTLTGRRLRPRRPYVLTAVHHKMKKGHRRRALTSDNAVVAH